MNALIKTRRYLDLNLGVGFEEETNIISFEDPQQEELAFVEGDKRDVKGDKDDEEVMERGVNLSKEEAVTFYEIPNENWVWVCKPGGEDQFNPDALTLYISPNPELRNKAKAVMFRVMATTSMRLIFRYALRLWDLQGCRITDPLLLLKDEPFNMERMSSSFGESSNFIASSGNIPPSPVQHSGKVNNSTLLSSFINAFVF